MTHRPDTQDYRHLFLHDIPLMDVRAPVEFNKGAFPNALNAPLMTDDERHRVGICYKERGQDAAIRLGHQLVRDDVKAERIARWVRFARAHTQGYLYCFRGGLRSRTTQQWLHDAGVDYPLVLGGYKALRRYLIDYFESHIPELPLQVISGRTGSGKTRVLLQTPNPIDLEGIARHRGSSFGRTLEPQPVPIDFENRIFIALLKACEQQSGPVFVEDESHLIGRCALPLSLRERMAQAPLLILERPMEERIDIILQDYVADMITGFQARDGEDAGWLNFSEYLCGSLARIRPRLGGERYQQLDGLMQEALRIQQACGELGGHRVWIQQLLQDYYDPMYDYQLDKKQARIVARGDASQLLNWAARQRR